MQSEWIYGSQKISVTRYYKSGRVESKESFDKELVRNGTSYLFYKNGNIKSEWNFKNGLRDGIQKNFFGENSRASDYAQAIMEIGAIICKPSNPLCYQCPISKNCQSYKKKRF